MDTTRYNKASAPVIDKDQDFADVLREILASKKIDGVHLNIDFNSDELNQYRRN